MIMFTKNSKMHDKKRFFDILKTLKSDVQKLDKSISFVEVTSINGFQFNIH